MPNHMKFCGCKCCRAGRHRPYSKFLIRLANRVFRRNAKKDLKEGKEPADKISIMYTD